MGLADRMRDAARATNTIEEVREPSLDRPQSSTGTSPVLATAVSGGSQVPEKGSKKPAYASEPDVITSRYYVENKGGERRYYDDYKRQTLAMRATDTSISSKREDLNTIKAMLDVAAARGWQSVNVKGSAEFRREAWIEGQARGLDVRGHRSSEPDRQEADRRRAERGLSNEVRAPAPPTPVTPAAPMTPVNPAASTLDPAHQQATKRAGQPAKPDPTKGPDHPAKPTPDDHRKAVREAQRELSPDGRTMLSAMSSVIDRQMNKLNSDAKAEMKAYVAGELVKKERTEGPIVLSAKQKRAATAPQPKPEPVRTDQQERSRAEPEAPRRMIGR
jgi:hypothetical protein